MLLIYLLNILTFNILCPFNNPTRVYLHLEKINPKFNPKFNPKLNFTYWNFF